MKYISRNTKYKFEKMKDPGEVYYKILSGASISGNKGKEKSFYDNIGQVVNAGYKKYEDIMKKVQEIQYKMVSDIDNEPIKER